MNWHKYPFVRLLLALSAGIVIADRFSECNDSPAVVYFTLVGLLLLLVFLHRLVKDYRHRWILGVIVIIVFFLLGYMARCLREPKEIETAQGQYVARIYEPPVEREKTVKALVELRGVRSDSSSYAMRGKLVVYLQKTDAALHLSYGDIIAFDAVVEAVPPPKNPNEFDYQRYLRRRGVTGRVYLKEDDWLPTGIRVGNPLFSFASRFRDRLLLAMKRSGITEDVFGVGAAILLGYDESLSPELRQQYVAAGSMHILCVSGMHVGIIYLLASYLLGFVGKGKKMARIRKILLLALIWFYALLTGLSPSIIRSALMISMMILGELIHRKGNLINSIAASAFVLLLVNPCNLFSMGFQLSYAAVAGIVLLQRPIYLLVYIQNKYLDKVWEITTVSLAAQVATMPFTVYYFNQFTPYFWLSNLLMTPLSFLVIMTGMILLLVSWIPKLSLMVGKMVWACLYIMNGSVSYIDRMPGSLIKGLYMNRVEFVLSLLMLLFLVLFVTLKRKRMMMELLVVACVFSASLAARAHQAAKQNRLVVYSIKNHTAIDLIRGQTHVLLCDDGLIGEGTSIDYSIKGAWASQQLCMNPPCYLLSEDMDVGWAVKKGQWLSFQEILFAFYDPGMAMDTAKHPISVDFLMVVGKQKPSLKRVLHAYRPAMLLVDGSVPSYLAEEWRSQAEALSIPCYCLEDGCYRYDCP